MKQFLGYLFFILMFIISGIVKVTSFGNSEAARLSAKVGVSLDVAAYIVLAAGIWELISAALIGYGVYNKDKTIRNYGLISLAIFTVLATLIFYVNPMKYKPLLSNLSILGAIVMIYTCT